MCENPFLYKARADHLFEKVWLKGNLLRWWSRLLGRKGQLLDLFDQKLDGKMVSRHYCGIMEIPLNQIKGSENRAADFDANFYPLKSEDRDRWVGIAELILLHGNLDAVNLIQIEDVFFVRDGHHRVSVARALGVEFIDAEVTQWQTDGKLENFSSSPGR